MTREDMIKTFYGDALQKLKVLICKIEQRAVYLNRRLPIPNKLIDEITIARAEFEQAEKLLKTI